MCFVSVEGEVLGVSHWHYFKAAEQVFNGSATHTDVPATEICSQAIIDVLRCAFHPRWIGLWKAERGIRREQKEQKGNEHCGNHPKQQQQGGKAESAKSATGLCELGPVLDQAIGSPSGSTPAVSLLLDIAEALKQKHIASGAVGPEPVAVTARVETETAVVAV